MASRAPVDAPDGTAARPMAPDSSSTSHSTVGLTRESRISRPMMSTIALMTLHSLNDKHIHDGRAFAGIAGTAVLPGVVERLRRSHGRKFHDHGAAGFTPLKVLGFAAAHQDLGIVRAHGER